MFWVKSEERQTRQISWWEHVTAHPARMKRQMKYSLKDWEKSHDCWPCYWVSAGNTTQHRGNRTARMARGSAGRNLGGSKPKKNLTWLPP